MFDIFLLGGLRFCLRIIQEYLLKNNSISAKTRVLIIGAGDAAELVIREMKKHPELDKEIVGLIDDEPQKKAMTIHGKKVLSNSYEIPCIIDKYKVNEVIIAILSADGKV